MQWKQILCPVDIDNEDVHALEGACELARIHGSHLHFLYVNDVQAGYRHPTDNEESLALWIGKYLDAERLSTVEHIFATSKGDLGEEVAKYAQDNQVDLIVIGQSKHGLLSAFIEEPDEQIIARSNLPVLMMPRTSR